MKGQYEGFFLTDKIFIADSLSWKPMVFPESRVIMCFCPISSNDIWFSVKLLTSRSMLYHYHHGIVECVSAPFENIVSSIDFPSSEFGFFSGLSEIALMTGGKFSRIFPVPGAEQIFKTTGWSHDSFCVLFLDCRMMVFRNGRFTEPFPGEIVKDFQYPDPEHGYFLIGNKVLEKNGPVIKTIFQDSLLTDALNIFISPKNEIWAIGKNGLILLLKDQHILNHSIGGSLSLNSLSFAGENDIWIAGDGGTLLYSGTRNFPQDDNSSAGFSAQSVITLGINNDDEYGVAIADFNNDGNPDIYTTCIYTTNRMYINNMKASDEFLSSTGFTLEAVERGVTGMVRNKVTGSPPDIKLGVAVADIDNDGDQDIFLPSLNSKNNLLLNKGNGYFRDVSYQSQRACENIKRANTASFADVDLDGDVDLFITSEKGSNRLYVNDGTGHFQDITGNSGLVSREAGMCASFCDINNDGLPDLGVTFWYPGNKIYINESKNGVVRFRDITAQTDLQDAVPAKSNGITFGDINNDGYPDLFIANRNRPNELYLNDGKGYFKDVSAAYFPGERTLISNGGVMADFDLDGYLDLYVTNVGESILYKNAGGDYFTEVTGKYGAELNGYCTGAATGDIDGDGDVDLYVANYVNGTSMLFMNELDKKRFVKFRVEGTRSNRDAIGVKIFLYKKTQGTKEDTLAGYREISGGGGYGSSSLREEVFALSEGVYYAEIWFPFSGIHVKIPDVKPGMVIRVTEETGVKRWLTRIQKAVIRFLSDKELWPEIIKVLLVLLSLLIYLRIQLRKRSSLKFLYFTTSAGILVAFLIVNQLFVFNPSLSLFFISPAVVVILLIIFHLYLSRILLVHRSEVEKKLLRESISRDLHDDLASTLGSISIYANSMKSLQGIDNPKYDQISSKIISLSRTAMQSIADIIWMTAPRYDTLQKLISKTTDFMREVLADHRVSFHTEIQIPDFEVKLSEKLKNNVFLILKEAIYNCIVHAEAENLTLSVRVKDSECRILLEDDGIGFNENEIRTSSSHGNGLMNIRKRAADSGVKLTVGSIQNKGTRVELIFTI